jgi:ABC-type transport system involved in cytochrome c biogenesis permease subunit
MKEYKTFDWYSQLLVLIVILVTLPFSATAGIGSVSLLIFAGLHIISLLVHTGVKKQTAWRSPLRKYHLIGVLVVLAIMIYGMIKPTEDKYDNSGLGVIIFALIPAAAVALFYTVITFLEYRKIKQQ